MTNEKILQTVDQISKKLDAVCQDNNEVKVEIARVIEQNTHQTRSLNEVKIAVDKLTQIVYTGNGQPSLIGRVSAIEAKSAITTKLVEKIEGVADEIHIEGQRTSKKYNLILAGMMCGLVLFICDAASGTEFIKFIVSVVKG
jgi:hypothetical protein